jgi:hypothetical protein
MITISLILEEIGSRFFITRWVPHELSAESKANRMVICQEMLEVLENLDLRQKNILLQVMNIGFTWIRITADNGQ